MADLISLTLLTAIVRDRRPAIWRFISFGPILSLNVLSVLAILSLRTHGIR